MTRTRERVVAEYEARWGASPDRVVFAPGRINLIGDHTDYSLLPVLPMAIQRGLAFAIGPGPDGIVVDSVDESAELRIGEPPSLRASWHRYAEAALGSPREIPHGLRVVFHGDLPPGSGLSSSSALVIGLLASLTGAGPAPLRGQALVDAALAAERHAAIEGGAMDQTIIVFGRAGAAMRLDFDPPSRRPVPLPPELILIAADSGERADKAGRAKDEYNARVVACRCAAALLSDALGADRPEPLVLGRLLPVPNDALEKLPAEATASSVARQTGVDVSVLVRLAAGAFPSERALPIRAVARHVVEEAARVDAAEQALRSGELERFGALLDASHASLRSFGSSTEALDRLTAAMVGAGALGARVTGAGFGGYAIAGCRGDRVDDVLSAARSATGGPAFVVAASQGVG